MQKPDWIRLVSFLLNAVIVLTVWNINKSIDGLKETINQRVDYVEKRIDYHNHK